MGFVKFFGLLVKTFLDSGDFFPHGSPNCVLRLQTTIVKESGFLEKEFL